MRCTCCSRAVIPCTRVTREVLSRECFFLFYSFGLHGIWEIDNSTGFYGAGTENHGETGISAGIVCMGMGTQHFHGNDLDGNWISIFLRGLFWVRLLERYLHGNGD